MRRIPTVFAFAFCLAISRMTAAACVIPTPMYHAFDSYFQCAEPLAAYAFQLSDPATNTDGVTIICGAYDAGYCNNPVSGVANDGRSTLQADWYAGGVSGCPIDASGPHRVVIVATREQSGEGLLVSLGGADPSYGYTVELAHPLNSSQALDPAVCGTTVTPVLRGTSLLTLRFQHPPIYTDCDPGSLGHAIDQSQPAATVCVDDFRPDLQFGPVYTLAQPCGDPVDLHRDRWVNTGVVPGADGFATIAFDQTGTLCRYTGSTTIVNGVETGILTGVFAGGVECGDQDGDGYGICAGDCNDLDPSVHPGATEVCNGIDDDCDGSVDIVFNPGEAICDAVVAADLRVNSALAHGSKVLTWTINAEKSLLGFNIVVLGQQGEIRLNDVRIPCEGCNDYQSHSYAYFLPRHKSGNKLYIEILKRDGSRAIWGPVNNPILVP